MTPPRARKPRAISLEQRAERIAGPYEGTIAYATRRARALRELRAAVRAERKACARECAAEQSEFIKSMKDEPDSEFFGEWNAGIASASNCETRIRSRTP